MRKFWKKSILCILVGAIFIISSSAIGKNNLDFISKGNGWEKIYGGEGNDAGDSICQTTDGGFIIIGETTSQGAGDRDIWVIKTDSNGEIEWEKTFGGENYDRGKCGLQTNDGGFIIVGYTDSYGLGGTDMWLIKTDADGDIEWENTFGGEANEEGVCVQQTVDGGFIVAGQTTSYGNGRADAWIVKTDINGGFLWEKTFGDEFTDIAEWIVQANDGGYIFTGAYNLHNEGAFKIKSVGDLWLVKIDEDGNKVWEQLFNGGKYNLGHAVEQTNDGGYIITGWTNAGYFSGGDAWLIKTDANGNMEWEKPFGKSLFIECAIGLDKTDDGGFIMTGCKGLITGAPAKWAITGVPLLTKTLVIKTDEDGNTEWQEVCGPGNCMGRIVKQCADGGYIIVGNTGNHRNTEDLLLIKINA